MQKLTNAQQWQQRNAAAMHQVCQLLGWSVEDYTMYQYKMGIAYIMWYWPANEQRRKQYECNKIFWNWFKNIWLRYDESWLSYTLSLSECTVEHRLQLYEYLHCPKTMAVEERPINISITNKQLA